jgi:lipopolysaccharide export system protein LptA
MITNTKRSYLYPIAFICVAMVLLIPNAWALKSDQEQPTRIDADKMTYSEQDNVNVFSGNVLLTRGSLVIRGEKLTLTQKADGSQFAVVEGSPATFKQQRDSDTDAILLIKGQANKIRFDGVKEQIVLSGNAGIQKTNNDEITEQITGNTITYEQKTEFLSVESGKNSSGSKPDRVQAIIKPAPQTGSTK